LHEEFKEFTKTPLENDGSGLLYMLQALLSCFADEPVDDVEKRSKTVTTFLIIIVFY